MTKSEKSLGKKLYEAEKSVHARFQWLAWHEYSDTLHDRFERTAQAFAASLSSNETATATIEGLRAEIGRLNDRLENNRVYGVGGVMYDVAPGSIPDGIECRDETIRLQDANLTTLRAENERLRVAMVSITRVVLGNKDPAGDGNTFIVSSMAWREMLDIARAALQESARIAIAEQEGIPS